VARDATARLYDVDADSVALDKKVGTITFRAKKGRVVPLDQLHESIRATRLGDGTGMTLKWLEVTAAGQVTADKEVTLKPAGSDTPFVLGGETAGATEEEKTAFRRLREAIERGEKVVSVTGRVEGWTGNLTRFSKKLPDKPRRLLVRDFQTVKPETPRTKTRK
jgi:hypothetical protein